MLKAISQNNWLTGLLILSMPVLLVFFLGSQMAYSQVKNQFEAYRHIPEVTHRSELAALPANQVVMVQGRMALSEQIASLSTSPAAAPDLLVFQERPTEGREVRFQEEFPLVFPEFGLQLPDGSVTVLPSLTRERVIRHELHTVTAGELEYTGFRPGDMVMVQGQWQPASATLSEVTGITGADKASLLAEWRAAFQKVSWLRNGLGLLTLLGIILLAVQIRRLRTSRQSEASKEWPTPKTKTTPTI